MRNESPSVRGREFIIRRICQVCGGPLAPDGSYGSCSRQHRSSRSANTAWLSIGSRLAADNMSRQRCERRYGGAEAGNSAGGAGPAGLRKAAGFYMIDDCIPNGQGLHNKRSRWRSIFKISPADVKDHLRHVSRGLWMDRHRIDRDLRESYPPLSAPAKT